MELSGKVALVTGAGSGIGEAIALRFAEEGASVIVNDLDLDSAKETAVKIRASGSRGFPIKADISSRDDVQAMVTEGARRLGTIDILVNNAGIGGPSILIRDLPQEAWDQVMNVNLKGAFLCCQAAIPMMVEKGGGKIVNIASLAARKMSKLGGADYTASKYGLVGFSHHLAFELAAYGINVNVVCPGATLTPLVRSKTTEEFRKAIAEQVPFGRWITPEDIAEAVLFLSSDRAAMITGVVIDVDGGQLLGVASDYKEDLRRREKNSPKNFESYYRSLVRQNDRTKAPKS